MFLTPLRAMVILIAPLLPFLVKRYFCCKINKKVSILYCIINPLAELNWNDKHK